MPQQRPPLFTDRESGRKGAEVFLVVIGIGIAAGLIATLIVGVWH